MYRWPPESCSSRLSASVKRQNQGRQFPRRKDKPRKPLPYSDNFAASLLVVLNHRENVDPGQLRAAVQECEFYRKRCADYFAAQLTHQLGGRCRSASGGKQIIADEDALAGLDCILVDLECVRAVLELVG